MEKTLILPKILHKKNNVDFTSCIYESDTSEQEDTEDNIIDEIHNSEGTIPMMYKVCNLE